jgi:transcriptional regulator NrdR family protein
MKCPYCKKNKTEVVNSRSAKGGEEVWRRRLCPVCKEVFTTREQVSASAWMVVKRNLSRRRFVYEKLYASLLAAVGNGKHRDQGDDALLAKRLAEEVLVDLRTIQSKYISTKDIIRACYKALLEEDQFFALRYKMYASYRTQVLKGV